jgi:repressor LexA
LLLHEPGETHGKRRHMKQRTTGEKQNKLLGDEPSNRLSPRQLAVLECIQNETSQLGRPPTYREIAKILGDVAVGTIQDHVSALIKKGFLEKLEGLSRGFRIANQSGALQVPVLGRVPAGRPIEAIEQSQGSVSVPSSVKGELFALLVVGESMIDAGIMDGDTVVVKKQSHAENGAIVVAMIDGEVTVKYLEKKSGHVRLLPANSKFKPIEIPPTSENIIQGIVVSVQRFYH